MADQDVKMLIERIMAEVRTHQSARFSNEIYADEPILSRPVVRCRTSSPTSTARCARYHAGKMIPKAARDVGYRRQSSFTAKAC